jgi:hypothetical protein
MWGTRKKIINRDTDGKKYDDAAPRLLVGI